MSIDLYTIKDIKHVLFMLSAQGKMNRYLSTVLTRY